MNTTSSNVGAILSIVCVCVDGSSTRSWQESACFQKRLRSTPRAQPIQVLRIHAGLLRHRISPGYHFGIGHPVDLVKAWGFVIIVFGQSNR